MAVSTNLGLYLPTREDYISVSRDLSNNYEIIDKSAGMLEKGIAIVIDGDTAPQAISSGDYLFIKNHSSLATGGYHATANIANGAAVNSSNTAADSKGVTNAIKADVESLNDNLSSVRNYTNIGNIASESALGTSLTSQLSGMPNNSAKLFKFTATASDGFIQNGNVYFVTLQKNDDGSFASAIINRIGSVVVIGSKGSTGWTFKQLELEDNVCSYDLGLVSTMPSIPVGKNGLYGFALSSDTTVGGVTLSAGTRFIGYCVSNIGHFVAIPNSSSIRFLRCVTNSWSILASL